MTSRKTAFAIVVGIVFAGAFGANRYLVAPADNTIAINVAEDNGKPIPVGKTVVCDLEPAAKDPKWLAIDATGKAVDGRVFDKGQAFAVEATTQGPLSIVVASGGSGSTRRTTLSARTVFVGKAGPGPKPVDPDVNPGPGPKPDPLKPRKLWVIVVEETAQRTAELGQLVASKKLADHIKAKGHHWQVIDKDSKPPAPFQVYVDRAKGQPLPMLFLQDDESEAKPTIIYEGKLPVQDSALIALLAEHGG